MKALLIILGLTLSLGAFAEDAKGYGEDQEGCGSADELKGCKCIKQSLVDGKPVEQIPEGYIKDPKTGKLIKK